MGKRKRFSLQRDYPDLVKEHYTPQRIEEWKAINILTASRQYRDRFLSGDEEAIFQFVKCCNECFREVWLFPDGSQMPCYSDNNIFRKEPGRSWVIEQIEKWKNEDTIESRKKLEKLFMAYVDSRGSKRKKHEEDHRIYSQIKEARRKTESVTKAIWEIVYKNMDKEISPNSQDILLNRIVAISQKKELASIAKETGISTRKLKAFIDSGIPLFNTYKEIYYEMEKLEKEKKKVFGA